MCRLGSFVKMVTLPPGKVVSVVREFDMHLDDGSLQSLFNYTHYRWLRKGNFCPRPTPRGNGGYWAYNDRKTMRGGQGGLVVARVHAYGTIAVHREGIRAEKMDIVGILDVRRGGKRVAQEIARRYPGLRIAPSLRGGKK